MAATRKLLDAYQLLTVKSLLQLRYNIGDKAEKRTDYEEIAEDLSRASESILSVPDQETISKLFNDAYKSNKPEFSSYILDAIVRMFKIPNCKNWREFEKKYTFEKYGDSIKTYLPPAHFHQLSPTLAKRVKYAVLKTLSEILPDTDISSLNFDSEAKNIPRKLRKNYLSSTWEFYFFYDNHCGKPKIGKAILNIGESPDDVSLILFKSSDAANFSGSIELDRKENYLVLNLKSNAFDEHNFYAVFDARNSDKPNLLIGGFLNVGYNNSSIILAKCVLERMDQNSSSSAATALDAFDVGFDQIAPEIVAFLKYKRDTFWRYQERIYSKGRLKEYNENNENVVRNYFLSIQTDHVYDIFISHPSRALSSERRAAYDKAYNTLTSFFEQYNLRVPTELSRKMDPDLPPPNGADYNLRKVKKSDLFILLYFDSVVSNSLIELAWAYQAGKPIIILTTKDKILPGMFMESDNLLVRYFDDKGLEDSVDFLMQLFPFYAENKFSNFKKN